MQVLSGKAYVRPEMNRARVLNGCWEMVRPLIYQWLRGKNDYRVEDHHVNNNRSDKVCEYFRPDIKQWDMNKIQNTFHEVDVSCILGTRIPQNQCKDRVAWMHTKEGCYMAKSGYHYWFDRQFNVPKGWKRIWELLISQKMKYFLWRICKNTIPVRNLLRGRGVQTTILCPMCNVDVEHVCHVFFDCPFAKSCWSCMGGGYNMAEVEYVLTWLLEKLEVETEGNLIKMVKVLWGIWFARNRKVWEDKIVTPQIAMEISSRMITEWKAAQSKQQGGGRVSSSSEPGDRVSWQLPDSGWYKANVDAAIHEGSSYFKIGMVLRDDTGAFVAGMFKKFDENASVLEAEAIGVQEALQWVCELGVSQVVVESDSIVVVNALRKNSQDVSEVGSTFECCRAVLGQRCDLKVQHVRRQANRVAHSIANLPCMSGTMNWFSTPPPCVLEMIVSDSSSV